MLSANIKFGALRFNLYDNSSLYPHGIDTKQPLQYILYSNFGLLT